MQEFPNIGLYLRGAGPASTVAVSGNGKQSEQRDVGSKTTCHCLAWRRWAERCSCWKRAQGTLLNRSNNPGIRELVWESFREDYTLL
jgi:hypothetical protein